MDDRQLLTSYICNGSQEAFAELVNHHIRWLYPTCHRLVRDEHLAQDVTQAVFLVLARRAKSIPAHRPLAAWLYQVARYAAANARRLEQRRIRREEQAMATRTPITDSPRTSEIDLLLDHALVRLSRRDRDTLLQHFIEDQSFADIAAQTGATPAAVKQRVHRALAKLREYFHQQGLPATDATLSARLKPADAPAVPSALPGAICAAALTFKHGAAMSTATALIARRTLSTLRWQTAKPLLLAAACTLTLAAATLTIHLASAAPASPTPVAAAQPDHGFVPPITITLNGRLQNAQTITADAPDTFLSLDTGKLFTKPDTLNPKDDNAMLRWMRSNNIDIIGDRSQFAGGLLGINLAAIPAKIQDWDNLTAADLAQNSDLTAAKLAFPATLDPTVKDRLGNPHDILPSTWLFKTKSGKRGILQITEISPNRPFGVKLRYKLAP